MSMTITETISEVAQAFWEGSASKRSSLGQGLGLFPNFCKGRYWSSNVTRPRPLHSRSWNWRPPLGRNPRAFAAYLGREGVKFITRYLDAGPAQSAIKQALVIGATGFCLCIDPWDALWDNEQSIRFAIPFLGGPGTLIDGTYVDDDACWQVTDSSPSRLRVT